MAGFFNKIKGSNTASSSPSHKDAVAKKKEEPVLDLTPLEKMLQNAGPLRDDGTDRFFGLENFGNTWYAIEASSNQAVTLTSEQLLQLDCPGPLLLRIVSKQCRQLPPKLAL
ncbi:hypothetical protein NW759_005711 [Fusarium solani]|nr:hypothetical protein NW759_005711 [Fusarium solani]